MLPIVEDGAHDVTEGSCGGAVVVAHVHVVFAGHQGGVADGRGQGEVAPEGQEKGIDDDGELHFEIEELWMLSLIVCVRCLLVCLLACSVELLVDFLVSRGCRGVYIPLVPHTKPSSIKAFITLTKAIS